MQQDEEETKNEMAGLCVHGPEKDGNKRMERQSKGLRGLETYCKDQGPPRAVAPLKRRRRRMPSKYYSKFPSTVYRKCCPYLL